MDTNKSAAYRFVEFGLLEKEKGRRESASGPGSSFENTLDIRNFIIETVSKYGICNIIDLGCGDWHWMQQLFQEPVLHSVSYEGWDVHDELIDELNKHHANDRIRFKVADIVKTPIPKTELIICRDVLFHLENDLVAEILANIKRSGSLFFMSTTYPGETVNAAIKPYLPIDGWGFRRINLDVEPFFLAKGLVDSIKESKNTHQGFDRYVALYRMDCL